MLLLSCPVHLSRCFLLSVSSSAPCLDVKKHTSARSTAGEDDRISFEQRADPLTGRHSKCGPCRTVMIIECTKIVEDMLSSEPCLLESIKGFKQNMSLNRRSRPRGMRMCWNCRKNSTEQLYTHSRMHELNSPWHTRHLGPIHTDIGKYIGNQRVQ